MRFSNINYFKLAYCDTAYNIVIIMLNIFFYYVLFVLIKIVRYFNKLIIICYCDRYQVNRYQTFT